MARFAPLFSFLLTAAVGAPELPVIPVGLDAYRQWHRWPALRVGQRTQMRSTFDRAGGNWAADASHYLYQLAPHRNVTMHVEGRGILTFARFNHWHGSPWRFEVDGVEHIVAESSTLDPHHPIAGSTFIPEHLFPEPLAFTWSRTHGADLLWVPIAFERSLRIMYGRTYYGTGYYIFQQFADSAPLSQPLQAWSAQSGPDEDVRALLQRSATELLPESGTASERAAGLTRDAGQLDLAPQQTARLWEWREGAGVLRALEFSVPRDQAEALEQVRLRLTWDDAEHASVDAPVPLFFGAGSLFNRDNRDYLVRAFPVQIRFDPQRVHLACVFPMPFGHSARLELVHPGTAPVRDLQWSVRRGPLEEPLVQQGYFHASYRDHGVPTAGEDLVLLDTEEAEGGGPWTGHLIGTSWIFSHRGNLTTLEGDPRFFFDDSRTPQVQGTGTEEWGGGGDYWGGRNMSLPFAGHPCGARKPEEAASPRDLIQSAYRFLLGDLMPFGRRALIRLEHGGENESTEHYETVTYWYGRRGATLVLTDQLDVGDAASEAAHAYQSPDGSAPYSITSRYEWGPDTSSDGRELYSAHRETGRTTGGMTEFTLRVRPDNLGVFLRRTLDLWFPNQRAQVFVARQQAGRTSAYEPAGAWLVAGGSTYYFSYPEHETAAPRPEVKRSNRRFRDDEFLLPRALTEGAEALRIRLQFEPLDLPLLPNMPKPVQAWSEIRYEAYSVVAPE